MAAVGHFDSGSLRSLALRQEAGTGWLVGLGRIEPAATGARYRARGRGDLSRVVVVVDHHAVAGLVELVSMAST